MKTFIHLFFKSMFLFLITTSLFSCNERLRTEESFLIDSLDGKETLADAKEVFLSGIDGDLKRWGINKSDVPTNETIVQTYTVPVGLSDSNFEKLFNSLGADLDSLCLTQAQIKNFCKKNNNWLLSQRGVTFFLFKVENQFFVAIVSARSNGLLIDVRSFLAGDVWSFIFVDHIVVQQVNN